MTDTVDTPVSQFAGIRHVTPEEITFFNVNGWVKLDQLFDSDLAAKLLEHVKATVQNRVEGDDDYVQQRVPGTTGRLQVEEVAGTNLRESDPWLASLATSRQLAETGAQLLDTRPLRILQDAVFYKPAGPRQDGLISKTGATPWHQDYPSHPMDRANGVQIWVAADVVTPEMGILRYLNGSHLTLPPMGKARAFKLPDGSIADDGAVAIYPWLLEKYEQSPPFTMQPGDAFAHHTMTMHYAGSNLSDRDRWAWAVHYFDARIAYNGAPNIRTDNRGLVINEPFDVPAFPIVID